MRHAAVIAGLVALLAVSTAVAAQTPAVPAAPVVVTQGEAIVKRAADRAWLSVAAETRDPRAEEARRRNAEAMTALQAALKGTGLAADAIRTTGYSLVPEMDWNNGRGVVRGYVARNQIELRIDDLDKLAAVIDAANTAKGTSISVNGPRFGLKDEAAAENEALRDAVQIAMTRAQSIAAGAKRTLGAIVRIEERGATPPVQPMPMMRMAAGAADMAQAPTPVSPGEIEVRASVTLTVELR